MKSIFKKKYKHEIAICAVAKNEDIYMEEWVIHHLSIGFEKIYIYDNNDVFGKVTSLLEPYIHQDKVQIINCSDINPVQLWAYMHFVRTNKNNVRWAAFIDIDEFIELENDLTIQDFVRSYEHAEIIVLSWLGYGANGEIWKQKGSLKQRFPKPAVLEQEYSTFPMHVKSICKIQHVKKFKNPHMPIFFWKKHRVSYNAIGEKTKAYSSYPFMFPIYQKAYIKHYFTKSYEEWFEKTSRGLADHTDMKRKIEEFFYLNPEMREMNLPKTLEGLNELKLRQ